MWESQPDYKKADREAQKILSKLDITQPPVMPDKLAESQGLSVRYAKFDETHNDQIAGYIDVENKMIIINVSQPVVRQRFTIAHEIGHWILHNKQIADKPEASIEFRGNNYPGGKPGIETEADAFAAELLVPLKWLRHYWEKGASSSQLASLFGVSQETIGYRIDRL